MNENKPGEELLALARRSIENALRNGTEPAVTREKGAPPQGAFVTLLTWPGKELRGCIGRIESNTPLRETVVQMAVSAARNDTRFNPVVAGEMDSIIIKVSALSPLRRVGGADGITIGEHGVVVRLGGRTGVFLPEVPVEYGWDAGEMLAELCTHKMRLPADAWKSADAEIYVFTTEAWEEVSPGNVGDGDRQ